MQNNQNKRNSIKEIMEKNIETFSNSIEKNRILSPILSDYFTIQFFVDEEIFSINQIAELSKLNKELETSIHLQKFIEEQMRNIFDSSFDLEYFPDGFSFDIFIKKGKLVEIIMSSSDFYPNTTIWFKKEKTRKKNGNI